MRLKIKIISECRIENTEDGINDGLMYVVIQKQTIINCHINYLHKIYLAKYIFKSPF